MMASTELAAVVVKWQTGQLAACEQPNEEDDLEN